MADLNLYELIEHMPESELRRLVVAHGDVQIIAEDSAPPSSETVPVPSAPTVPVRRAS